MKNIYTMKDREVKTVDELQKIDPFKKSAYKPYNDLCSARLFAKVYGEEVKYVPEAKMYYIYDGTRWVPDIDDIVVGNYAKDLSKAVWIYALDCGSPEFNAYAVKLQSEHKRSTMIRDARSLMAMSINSFDKDKDLINCKNCVYDLKHSQRREQNPKYYMTKTMNVDYTEGVTSPAWNKFIDEVMCGDSDKARYLQEILGYALTGTNTQEECYMFYGATTRNGKSTLLDVIEYIMGDYAMNVQPETLAMKDRNSGNASGDIARLKGVRLAHVSEFPKKMKTDNALLKAFLGRDPITARHLYEREIQFVPEFKLFMNTNYLPIISDDTVFASERIKVISFDRHFEKAEQNIHLKDELKTAANTAGIFNWMLEGLKRYRRNKEVLTPPEAVIKATEEYREQSDKVRLFMNECLLPEKDGAVLGTDVYNTFCDWCKANGYFPDSKRNLFYDLRQKGLLHDRATVDGVTRPNVVKGYRLDTADFEEDNPFARIGNSYTRR